MKVAAQEVFARKTLLSDGSDDDTTDPSAAFELALATLQAQRQSASTSTPQGDGESQRDHAHTGDGERKRRPDPLDDAATYVEGLAHDVAAPSDVNPVLAALAALRGPWQTIYGSGGSANARAHADATRAEAGPSSAAATALTSHASNVRRIDERLTDHTAEAATTEPRSTTVEDRTTDPAAGATTAGTPLSQAAETALIALQNQANSPTQASAVHAPEATTPGANVPALPPQTAQRLVDGTVAALRIDRDTANPLHSASYIEVRHPELGIVKAEVRVIGDAMEVRFDATGAAAVLLRASESELRKALSHHGMRLRHLQVESRGHLLSERSRRARRHLLDLEA